MQGQTQMHRTLEPTEYTKPGRTGQRLSAPISKACAAKHDRPITFRTKPTNVQPPMRYFGYVLVQVRSTEFSVVGANVGANVGYGSLLITSLLKYLRESVLDHLLVQGNPREL